MGAQSGSNANGLCARAAGARRGTSRTRVPALRTYSASPKAGTHACMHQSQPLYTISPVPPDPHSQSCRRTLTRPGSGHPEQCRSRLWRRHMLPRRVGPEWQSSLRQQEPEHPPTGTQMNIKMQSTHPPGADYTVTMALTTTAELSSVHSHRRTEHAVADRCAMHGTGEAVEAPRGMLQLCCQARPWRQPDAGTVST